MIGKIGRFSKEKGFTEVFRELLSIFRAKIFNIVNKRKNLRRFPISSRILGRPYINFGKNIFIGERCRIEAVSRHGTNRYQPRLVIGNNSSMNDDVHIACIDSVSIGENVLMASKIYISDHNHGEYASKSDDGNPATAPNLRKLSIRSIVIEDNVWIGEMVSILPGASIGYGSIIGANSVVTGIIPPYSIAVGIPARVIKTYNLDKKIWERIK